MLSLGTVTRLDDGTVVDTASQALFG